MNIPLILHYLQLWNDIVMGSDSDLARLGYPKRSMGISAAGVSSFDEMYEDDEKRIAHDMDGVINSLPLRYQEAVWYVFKLRKISNGMTDLVVMDYENRLRPADEVLLRIWSGMESRGVVD